MIHSLQAAKHRDENHRMEDHPLRIILTQRAAILQDGIAKYLEDETKSRQIGIAFPSSALAAPAIRIVPESDAGASRGVTRGASLGEQTSVGACNSQRTLYVAKRPTATAYRAAQAKTMLLPSLCFASLQLWH